MGREGRREGKEMGREGREGREGKKMGREGREGREGKKMGREGREGGREGKEMGREGREGGREGKEMGMEGGRGGKEMGREGREGDGKGGEGGEGRRWERREFVQPLVSADVAVMMFKEKRYIGSYIDCTDREHALVHGRVVVSTHCTHTHTHTHSHSPAVPLVNQEILALVPSVLQLTCGVSWPAI